MNKELTENVVDNASKKSNKFRLILHNDDFNTFDHVIESLEEVCFYSHEQAEQCALITHYKGRYDIKSGAYHALQPYKKGLAARDLTVTIE